MSWGDLISGETKTRGGKVLAPAGHPDKKALGKIGSRRADPSDCLIEKQAIILDMGEASREQGFRLNGCR